MSLYVKDWYKELNEFGYAKKPCYFVIDFLGERGKVLCVQENEDFSFNFSGDSKKFSKPLKISTKPIHYSQYKTSFKIAENALNRGDTYLINLTFSTPIEINYNVNEIYEVARAKYKILNKNKWVCFSPEPFIKTYNNQIFTFPMKGTINADIIGAEELLLSNKKESAEHFTIVDLLRNDLSQVVKNVKVNRYRYLEKIFKHDGTILQASSEIQGDLMKNWQEKMGDIIKKLLPAGSISGAPKQKTLDVIQAAETHQRGFYTGIAGYFDGVNLDTAVMIRFIENINGQLYFKSGGGVTAKSIAREEYNEVQEKIYIPI